MNLSRYASGMGFEPAECENCFHCKYKWNCYNRQVKGQWKSCKGNTTMIENNINNYLWFDKYGETPIERAAARKIIKMI